MKKIIFLLLALSLPLTAMAYRQGALQAGAGMGLGVNPPVRFDLQLNGEYFVRENISAGLNIDFLLRGVTTFLFEGFGRYHFDLDRWPSIVPYLGGGLGAGVTENGGGILDFMIPDFGFKWEAIADRLFVGPDLSVHILTNGDTSDWDFRILFFVASYRF